MKKRFIGILISAILMIIAFLCLKYVLGYNLQKILLWFIPITLVLAIFRTLYVTKDKNS